jgi:hypothetical protein
VRGNHEDDQLKVKSLFGGIAIEMGSGGVEVQ